VASTVADSVAALACVPGAPVEIETSCVDGVQPEATPAHVSRKNAWTRPFVAAVARFVADDKKAT
jgi:hypothetical protein